MEKNKNRTDLLAAGRKKLQQYRQKKDGKGSKPSGKANKPDSDVVSDEASSVAKSAKGKKQVPATEVPVQGSATELVDSSLQGPTDNIAATNADVGTPDLSTSNLQIEVSEADEDGSSSRLVNEPIDASVPDKGLQISNLDDAMPTISSPHVPVMPVGLKAILGDDFARKAGELNAAHGEDQVPDVGAMQEHDHSSLEPDNRTNLIDLEGDMDPVSPRLEERAQVNSGDVEEDAKMEYNSSVTEQISERDGFPAVASAGDDSAASHFLPISDGFPLSDPESTIEPKEDVVAGFHGDEGIKLPRASADSEYASPAGGVISGREVTPVDLPQLAKVFQLLGEDEFRFLIEARDSVNNGHLKTDDHMKSGSVEFSERLKEQLYINSFEKELIYLQLCEEWDVRKEFDQQRLQWVNDKLVFSASLGDVEGKNKILSEELARCRSELDRVTSEMEKLQTNVSFSKTELDQSSARIEDLQIELDRSEHQLSNVSSELVDTRSLLSDLLVKNENLNVSIASLTEEKNKLEKEKGDVILENEKLSKDLMECNSLLELTQVENANAKGNLAHLMEERTKLEEEKQDYASEKDRLLTELVEWKRSVEALQVENAKLNEVFTSEREDRSKLEEANEHLVQENKKFSSEILEFQHLVQSLRSEIATLIESLDLVTKRRAKLGEEMDHLSFEKEECLTELTNCKTLMNDLQVKYEKSMNDLKDGYLRLEQLTEENVTLTSTLDMYKAKIREFDDWTMKSGQESILVVDNSEHVLEQGEREISHRASNDDHVEWDVFEDSSGFVALKRRLSELEKVMQELDQVIAGMHSHSAAPGVSKLVQNFELKGNIDESEEMPSGEDSELHMTAKKKIDNLKDLFRDLVVDVENASELFKVERSGKTLSDNKLEELMVHVEAMKEQSNSLEETFFKHVILDEIVKQYVATVEAKKGELVVLCEDLRQEGISTKAKNSELTEKLSKSESRICELRVQVDELHQQEDRMVSLSNQLETLHKKLDASIGTISVTHSSETGVGQNIGTRLATSVDAAVAVIQDLQGKLEDAFRNHNMLSDSYKDLAEKNKDLEGRNELVAYVLHKVFDNLQKLVNDAGPSTEESHDDIRSGQLDDLEIGNYDVFIERLIMILHERAQLESLNRQYNLELLERLKDMEELHKRCIHPDIIVKLLGDIQSVVRLEEIEIKPDEPVSSLESIIHFLIKRDRGAEEQVGLLREKLKPKEMELIKLQKQIDHLSFSIIPYEIEGHIFKESLRSAMEQLLTLQSEKQLKETELHQSEQRVSALREKLHIAVTKGKGLIQQRDSLKQSLTATSSELEKCLHELQLKDATLQETETKLKAYSEAGERMEALESELSYIRNSATALRESFLLKDSVLQRIEEILEDLELPEHFHVRDIIDKIDWLAKSVSQNSFPASSWNQNSSTGAGPYPDSGSGAADGWREDLEPASGPGDELRTNYEELQNKFYGLAEQNEMLEQSLMERNKLVQRWEEVLDKINMPPQLRSLEPEDRIEWLGAALVEANEMLEKSLMERNKLVQRWEEALDKINMPPQLRSLEPEGRIEWLGASFVEANEMLEKSLMERKKLVQRWEEALDKINMPPQLRSLEPEGRIEWLGAALVEANCRCDSLQQDIYDLEKVRGSLAADLEESQRRLVDLETGLRSITDEREQLSASLEVQSRDCNKFFEKATLFETENEKLQNEVGALQLKLDEKRVDEEHIHHIHGEIRRLQDLVKDMLQVPETEDLDSSTSDIECLEGLLRKLADKYAKHPLGEHVVGDATEERGGEQSGTHGVLDLAVLERKLEEAEGDLVRVKDERDRHVETNQSLVHEVEVLEVKNQELQKLLVQEEQKSATVREKLNVAVRKGKSLVQQRDSMKQSINDLTSEVERLNTEIKVRENTLLEYQQKMKDLITSQEVIEDKNSEIRFLKNHLAEADSELQDKRNTLSMILDALAEIDLGVELRTNDPVEKLQQIEKVWHDLQVAMSSSEQDSRKSKRAAELLLAELNEVQERNEDLLEELSKTTMEISKLSKERDSAEAAKSEALSRLEQLSALHLEERNGQFSELMRLKSGLDQLRPGFSKIYNLLNDVLPKDLEYLYNLEASIKSSLESSDTSNVGGQTLNSFPGGISSRSENKVNVHSELFLDSKTEEQHNDNKIIDLWRFVGSNMQDLITNINGFEEKLQSHSKCLHEEVIILSETVATLSREMTSHKYSLASAKEEIAWFESTGKQKETENLVLRKYILMLYEACKSSVLEIEKSKGQDSLPIEEDILSGEALSVSEERIMSMVNRLLLLVKDFHSVQAETVEMNLKEMKATISSLQKEVTEKDIQKDRVCVELVSQIKQAEAAAMSNLQELETARSQINDLKGQLEAVNLQHKVSKQRVKELEGQESTLVDLHEKVKSLTDALKAKEQEAEALLQALDEEEAQMEDLTNKISELERLVQQKDLDLESAEAARGKALKKLSITVSKFDELHHLSETLLSEVDKLQSQLQERDSEISFLRDEITRCTSDSLQALKTDKKGLDEIQDILIWLDSMMPGVETHDMHLDGNKSDQVHECKETLKRQITSIISELKDLRQVSQSKDDLLHIERSKVEDLMCRRELLENALRERESHLSMHQNDDDSAQTTSMTSEIVEVEPMIKKWPLQGTSIAPQVRSLRKVNNEQLAISIDDMDSDDRDKFEDEDDDKAHGFKSLTTSKLVPRFTRPVTDFIDGLWVSCDRALMRQPVLRLSLILYWAVMHALLAVFVV